MAEVTITPALKERKWLTDEYLNPYVRASGFDRYMGKGADAIIRVFTEEKTDGGKEIIVPLVGLIRGAGVTGSQVLEGNEDDMGTYVDAIRTNWRRNAIKVPKSSQYRSNLDILRIARPKLREWAANVVLKQGIIAQLQGVVIPGASFVDADGDSVFNPDTVIPYATATAAQRNTYLANNSDRILFGIDFGNNTGTWATSLANVDNTNDKLTTSLISKSRRAAQDTASYSAANTRNAITPYMTEDGEETMLMLVGPRQMRDLRADAAMQQANRDAMERGRTNPLFRAGDLYWDGVIIREMFDMPVITGAGAGGIDVQQAFLMGQSAIGIAWGQEPRLITDKTQDYEFRPAVAIEEVIGMKKLSYLGKTYGTFTVITAAVADS